MKGSWASDYGSDGWILCAFDQGTDRQRLPSYVSQVVSKATDPFMAEFPTLERRIIEASAPFGRDAAQVPPTKELTAERQIGFWRPGVGNPNNHFTFQIQLTGAEPVAFDLSLYAHSAQLAAEAVSSLDNPYPYAPLLHFEQYGRALVFRVKDLDGTREFPLPSDGAGVWTTFTVRGSSDTDVEVQVEAMPEYNTYARLAAVAFDPARNRTTELTYDFFGNVVQVTDPLGNLSEFSYWDPTDPTGPGYRLLSQVTDPRSKTTKFFYTDSARNLTRIEDPAQNGTDLTYDENSNVLTVQDANGYTTTRTYDDKNRLLTSKDNANHQTTLDYDDAGNVESVSDPQSRFTYFTYTNMNRLRTVTDDDGNVWTLGWDKAGNLVSVTDPRSDQSTLQYDDAGQLVRVVQADTQTVETAYDALGRVVATVTPNGTQLPANTPTTGLANLLTNPGAEEQDPFDGVAAHARFWEYPILERVSSPARTGAYSLKQWGKAGLPHYYGSHSAFPILPGVPLLAQGYAYCSRTDLDYKGWFRFTDYTLAGASQPHEELQVLDVSHQTGWKKAGPECYVPPSMTQKAEAVLGLRAEADDAMVDGDLFWDDLELLPLGTGYLYDASGRLAQVVQPDGSVFRMERDRFGNVSRTVDALGRSTDFAYDGLDRLVKVTDPLGNSYELGYDAAGNLASFKEPDLTTPTTYSYDDVGRLETITYPDASTEQFTYLDNGDLWTYTDPSGRVFTFSYDTADRLETITYPGTPATTVGFTYDDAGHVATRTERNGDLSTFTRNDLYQVTRDVMSPGSGSSTRAWNHEMEYDAAGNRRSLKSAVGIARYGDPNSRFGSARYGIGDAQALWSVPAGTAGYDSMNRLKRFADADGQNTDFTYDAEGRRTSITYPNGAVTQATYDFLGRLLTLTTTRSGSTLLKLTYGYDRNGNRVRQVADTRTFDYRLDDDDRLVGESTNCLSVKTARELRRGTTAGTDTARRAGKLILLGWDNADDPSDTFAGTVLNVDRWRPVLAQTDEYGAQTEPDLSGFRLRQQGALELIFPEGYTDRVIFQDSPVKSTYGLSRLPLWGGVEHRRLLSGNFAIEVDFELLQQVTAHTDTSYGSGYGRVRVGLMVNALPAERRTGPLAAIYRTVDPDPVGLGDVWESQIQPTAPPATVTPAAAAGVKTGAFRIQRVSGQLSTWYRPGNGAWVQLGATTAFSGDNLRVTLLMEGTYAPSAVRFTNFVEDYENSPNYPASGTYESEVYDSGQDSAAWDTLTWTENLPTGTDVTVDVAVQNSTPFGTWNYSGGYTNPAGSSLSGRTGRYLRYRVTLAGGANTPEASQFRLTFGTGWQDRTYGFDGRGNMTSKEVVSASGTVSEARAFNDLNQITQNVVTDGGTTTWTYTFDDNGNLATKSDGTEAWAYTFDDDCRLVRVVKVVSGTTTLDVAYSYDSAGRMLTRKLSTDANPTRFEWDGWDLVREVDPDSVETVYYAPQGEIMSFRRGSDVYQIHADALGSVRRVSALDGAPVADLNYDAWGSMVDSSGPLASIPNRFVGAAGVRFEAVSGLSYMRNRWYSSVDGSFVSRDRAIGDINIYAYAVGMPQMLIDPLGLDVAIPQPAPGPAVPDLEFTPARRSVRTRLGSYAISLIKSGISGRDAMCRVMRRAADLSDNNLEFIEYLTAIFINPTQLHFPVSKSNFQYVDTKTGAPIDYQTFDFTGDWGIYSDRENGLPTRNDQAHHLVVFMTIGQTFGEGVGSAMVPLESPGTYFSNYGDSFTGYLGVWAGSQLRGCSNSKDRRKLVDTMCGMLKQDILSPNVGFLPPNAKRRNRDGTWSQRP